MIKDTALLNLQSNSNIGLYLFATEKVTLTGVRLRKEQSEVIDRILKTKTVQVTVAGTPYPGLFLVDLEDEILAPSILFEHEVKAIEKHTGKKVVTINASETALRNIMAVHKNKAIISDTADKSIKEFLQKKGMKTLKLTHSEFETIGSLIVLSENSGLIAPVFDEATLQKIEEFLEMELWETTVNNRGVFLSSGLCFNSKGILIGEESLTEEVMDITEGLSEEEGDSDQKL